MKDEIGRRRRYVLRVYLSTYTAHVNRGISISCGVRPP
jgi:hypothetical protein